MMIIPYSKWGRKILRSLLGIGLQPVLVINVLRGPALSRCYPYSQRSSFETSGSRAWKARFMSLVLSLPIVSLALELALQVGNDRAVAARRKHF